MDSRRICSAASCPIRSQTLTKGRDNARVVWGSADQSALKAQVIVPLLQQKGTVYDVSAPSNPTV